MSHPMPEPCDVPEYWINLSGGPLDGSAIPVRGALLPRLLTIDAKPTVAEGPPLLLVYSVDVPASQREGCLIYAHRTVPDPFEEES